MVRLTVAILAAVLVLAASHTVPGSSTRVGPTRVLAQGGGYTKAECDVQPNAEPTPLWAPIGDDYIAPGRRVVITSCQSANIWPACQQGQLWRVYIHNPGWIYAAAAGYGSLVTSGDVAVKFLTNGADYFWTASVPNGAKKHWIIFGFDGDDTVDTADREHDHHVDGMSGNDEISFSGASGVAEPPFWLRAFGGDGEDELTGSDGKDQLIGGPMDDEIVAGADDDSAWGGAGQDIIWGGDGQAGTDEADGGADYLVGGNDYDDISGEMGDDVIFGGGDGDWLTGNQGADRLLGQEGADTLLGDASCESFINCGDLPSDGNDLLCTGPSTAGESQDIWAYGGDDSLFAQGWSYLDGASGNDMIDNDYEDPGPGESVFEGGEGEDTIDACDGVKDWIYGGNGADIFMFELSPHDSMPDYREVDTRTVCP